MSRKRFKSEDISKEMSPLFEEIDKYISKGGYPNIKNLFEELLNYVMKKEREHYLTKNTFDYANGYYNRKLNINFGELNLKIPRVRIGNSFRPALLPPKWKRVDKDYEELLLAMLSNGYSKAKIEKTFRKIGLPYSEDSLEIVEDLIKEKLDYFKTRPLGPDWFCVFIDAYHCEIRADNKMQKTSIFVAVGIDLEGYKHILGYWIRRGNENLGFRNEVFQDLINRGLSKVLVFVTDNFQGLNKLIQKLFPLSEHQLCFVHLARNIKNKLSAKTSRQAISYWKKIKMADDYKEGEELYEKLLDVIRENKPDYGNYLSKLKENYLNFLKYPEEIRKYIYTTNIVESLNAGLEKMRYDTGGYLGSRKMLEINLFVQLVNIHDNWLRKPNPVLKGKSYELKQLFNIKFNLTDIDEIYIHNF
jgi:transposase-like protein